jgi:hypothetical protein
MTRPHADNLSGRWDGIFNYPDGQGSNSFVAVLRDSGGILVGETSEPSDVPSDHGPTLIAWIEGRHDGGSVAFVKSYDDPSRADYTISYQGSVSPDSNEINGVWDIPGIWSGTFIMVRPTGKAVAAEQEVAETVR